MSTPNQNPYKFTIKGVTFDFYDLSDFIQFEQSAVEHAVKKLVALGKRSGNKSYEQDLHEAIMSLLRAQEQLHDRSLLRVPPPHPFEKFTPVPPWGGPLGDVALPSAGRETAAGVAADPNDLEEAVKFIWKLAYTDAGPP